MSGGLGFNGEGTPAVQGYNLNNVILNTGGVAERVTPLNIETSSVLVVAPPGNSGTVWVGFDDAMGTGEGVPLNAEQGVSFGLDTSQQPIYAVEGTAGDAVNLVGID
jgi:hypothetical protein